ncbi:MAG: hypothetical protein AAF357_08375, partial [Verrucomicrobiota bacterium]
SPEHRFRDAVVSGFALGITPFGADRLHVEHSIDMLFTFQNNREARLSLAHQRHQGTKDFGGAGK